MRIPRIFCESTLKLDATITLSPKASNHVLRVLRLKPGAPLILFDGSGGEYNAELIALKQSLVTVAIKEFQAKNVESPFKIHLIQGIPRGEKMEYVIQKSTELGVDKITPIFTERCNVKLSSERLYKKQQHWQQIAISACEQCGRNYIPTIANAVNLLTALTQKTSGPKLILAHKTEQTLAVITQKPTTATILIGPEGGLSATEIQLAQQHDYQPIKLGPRILRTETAALVAIAALQTKWGDLL